MYNEANYIGNCYALKILFNNDGSDYNEMIDRIKKYHLLEEAVYMNDYDFAKNILNYNVFNLNLNYEKVLIEASNNNNIYLLELLIKTLLRNSINNKKSSSKKYNPQFLNLILNKAIENDNINLIKYLFKSNEFKTCMNINVNDIKGEYPIIKALYSKNIDIFKYLLEQDADTSVKDNNGNSLLSIALDNNSSLIDN